MRGRLRKFGILAVAILSCFARSGDAQSPVVHAVLFYSPSCGHCHKVMTEDLPPLRERFGAQLEILEVNVQEPEGAAMYQAAVEKYTPSSRGVPMLIVGEHVLIGSVQIPERLPELVEAYVETGGVPWPALPHLPGAPAATQSATPAGTTATVDSNAVMQLVYFQSPSCGGCRTFENEVLAHLRTLYDERLQVTTVNTSDAAGRKIYEAAVAQYHPAVRGVPTVILGDAILVGNQEATEQLPAQLEIAATSGGALLPGLPGLEAYLATTPTPSPIPKSETPPASLPWGMVTIAGLAVGALVLVLIRMRR